MTNPNYRLPATPIPNDRYSDDHPLPLPDYFIKEVFYTVDDAIGRLGRAERVKLFEMLDEVYCRDCGEYAGCYCPEEKA